MDHPATIPRRNRQRPALAALLGIACAALLAVPTMANVPFWGAKAPVPFVTPPHALKRGEFT